MRFFIQGRRVQRQSVGRTPSRFEKQAFEDDNARRAGVLGLESTYTRVCEVELAALAARSRYLLQYLVDYTIDVQRDMHEG